MRYDVFSDKFEKHVKDVGLKKLYRENIKYKAKTFNLQVLTADWLL